MSSASRRAAVDAAMTSARHEHQSRHDPFTKREPGCKFCADWEHPAVKGAMAKRAARDLAEHLATASGTRRSHPQVVDTMVGGAFTLNWGGTKLAVLVIPQSEVGGPLTVYDPRPEG